MRLTELHLHRRKNMHGERFPQPYERTILLDDFQRLLLSVCARDTSADPDGWSPTNPLWGHCAVVSVAAKDRFDGKLLRASLEPFPKWAHMRSHYWNRFPNEKERDFTSPQFGDDPPQGLVAEERTRAYVLGNAATMERYKLLSWRLAKALHPREALFEDELYRACYMAAMDSPCKKMRFGSVLMASGEVVATACNGTIEPMKHLCEPTTCIRLGIDSRTESMLGACGHAEEFAIWDAIRNKGVRPSDCDLYVAGVKLDGTPWIKESAEHTCLRCANLMHFAGIQRVFVPVAGRWESVTTAQAIEQAIPYARKQKSV